MGRFYFLLLHGEFLVQINVKMCSGSFKLINIKYRGASFYKTCIPEKFCILDTIRENLVTS